ncbi:cytochrome P450 [Streptomyces mauvecolor]|uniref:Cytochrome P450 n=1 Tax=Streptomyces mauvecolor TaxID=58345 RepID=A0ABV9UYY1_9ACTN
MPTPQAPTSEETPTGDPLPHYPFSTRGDRLAPELAELQGRCPVARVSTNSGDEAWLVTGYELTQHVLRDRAFGRSVLGRADSPGQDAPIIAPELLDAMNHLQKAGLRDEVLKALGRDQPSLPADWVEGVTREGLDAMVREGGPADLQHHFAEWVAAQCMCRLLGLPFDDHAWLAVRADLDLTMVTPTHEELARNWEEIRVYMHEHMTARSPGEPRGLADRLADLNAEQSGLTDRQLSNIVSVLFVSGYEDFASFLGVAAFNLLQRPEVMDAVRARPETMPSCVEELLRYSVVLGNAIPRFVTRDTRLGSAEVKEGEMILLSLDAVNHDPAAFSDPGAFDPTRSPNPHLRFGYGRHHCPGAHLVRRQSGVAFRTLLDRLPALRLAVPPEKVTWHPNRMAIMAAEIPVTW